MKRLCVLGHQIAHSRSPVIHRYWIKKYDLDGSYGIMDIPADRLSEFFGQMRNGLWHGCNVTTPHKTAVMQYLDHIDETAVRLGAVNTVYVRGSALYGTNTDGTGFMTHLKNEHPHVDASGSVVLILGAGGAARSILDAFARQGTAKILLSNRTKAAADALAARHGDQIAVVDWTEKDRQVPAADILVNTTSLGMRGRPDLDIDLSMSKADCLVCDIVYVPLETALLKSAKSLNRPALDGLGMLLHQARPGFRYWFEVEPELDSRLRELVVEDILHQG